LEIRLWQKDGKMSANAETRLSEYKESLKSKAEKLVKKRISSKDPGAGGTDRDAVV